MTKYNGFDVEIVRLNDLKHHEEIHNDHRDELLSEIKKDGFVKNPIIVDKRSMIILDGHHRATILEELGYTSIPVCFVDYDNDAQVQVGSWRDDEHVTKPDVIWAGLTGNKLKAKTSKHEIKHRPANINVSLETLR